MSLLSYLFPLAVALSLAAVASATWAVISGRAKYLAVAGVCFLLGAGVFSADWYIVTEDEIVNGLIDDLGEALVAGDKKRVLSFFSTSASGPRMAVNTGMGFVAFDNDLRITDLSTAVVNNDTQATSDFRANGTVRVPQLGGGKHYATKWQFVWRKEAGEWKVVEVRRFNPLTEEPMGLLDRN